MRERRTEGKSRKRRFGARLMAVILAAGIAAAAAAGCGVKQEEPDDGRLKIVTTIFPQYDFVRGGRHRGRQCQDASLARRRGALLRTDPAGY